MTINNPKKHPNFHFKRSGRVLLPLVVLTFIFFSINLVSAFDFDNVLTYEKEDMKVSFNNCDLWLGTCLNKGELFGSIELKSHSSVTETKGYGFGKEEVVMYYDFTTWDLTKDGLGEVIFTDMTTGEEIEKDYEFVIWKEVDVVVDDYANPCNPDESLQARISCNAVIVGSHVEKQFKWVKYDSRDIPEGNSRIGLKTYVGQKDYVDGVWTIVGKEVSKHITWAGDLDTANIAYWGFDEGTGSTLNDEIGANDWTTQGMEEGDWLPGISGTSLNFTPNEYASGGSFALAFPAVTIQTWYRPFTRTAYITVLGTDLGGRNDGEFEVLLDSNGNPAMQSDNGVAQTFLSADGLVKLDEFSQQVSIYNTTGMFLFIDGVFNNSNTVVNQPDLTPWRLGDSEGQTQFWNGRIDEVGIWSRTLSLEEIEFLYNGGAGRGYQEDDAGAPNVTLNTPLNNTNSSTSTITFNATVRDPTSAILNVSFILDGVVNETNVTGVNGSAYLFTKTLSPGNHNWSVRAWNDVPLVTTENNFTLFINISIGTELITPINRSNFTVETNEFIFNSTPINQNLVFGNMTAWFSNGTVSGTNTTSLSGTDEVQTSFTLTLLEGSYIWGASTIGTVTSNISSNRTFTIHTTAPFVTLESPTGVIESFAVGDDLSLNWTITEGDLNLSAHIINCSYTYDGVEIFLNLTACVETNQTTFLYVEGVDEILFEVEDIFNLTAQNTTSWAFNFLETSAESSNNSFETDNETFNINITSAQTITSFTAFLNYNGTAYEADSTCVAGDCEIEAMIDIPVLNPDQLSENKTFFWQLTIFNGTGTSNINTSTRVQNVTAANFVNCSAAVVNQSVNFTIFDETNLSNIAANFEGTFSYYLGTGDVKKQSNLTDSGRNHYLFCTDNDETFIVDSQITLSETNYDSRIFSFSRQRYNSTNINQTLLLLNSTLSSKIIIEVKDQGLIPQQNIIVNISRFYPGLNSFIISEHQITDEFGQIITHLIEDSVKYRFTFSSLDNVIIKTSEDVTVACRAAICVIPFVLEDTTQEFERFENLTTYSFTLSFNNVTNIFAYTWNDQRGESASTRLEVTRYQFNGSSVTCNETSLEILSTMTCSVGSIRASYKAQVFRTVGSDIKRITIINISVGDPSQTYGVEGLLWVFILLMTCVGIGAFNPTVGVSLYGAGFIAMGILGVISMPIPVFFANTLLVILFIWGMNKR